MALGTRAKRVPAREASSFNGLDGPGRKGVLDLVATVGFYTTLGFILNSFGVPLDDDAAAELDRHPMPA